jgi:hypothetical protein
MGNFVSNVSAFVGRYRKAFVALGAGLAVVLTETAQGGGIDWVVVGLAVLGSFGVFVVPNTPKV